MKMAILLACAAVMAMCVAPNAAAGEAKPREIRVERVIAAPIERVWRAWTTTEGWREAMDLPLNIELRPGGPFEVWFAPDAPEGERGSEGCTVLSYLPGRMLSFSWNSPPKYPNLRAKGPATIVVVELHALSADQTLVTLTHHGWPDAPAELAEEWDGSFAYFTAAWPKVLEWMATSLEKESGAAPIDARAGWVYLLRIARGVGPSELTDQEKAKISEHGAYLRAMLAEGSLVLAGPCTDFVGPGIVVFQATDEEAAKRIMENDPAVKAGVFTAALHPMRLSLLRR